MKGRIEIDKERCKSCGLCVEACRNKAIEISDELNAKGYYAARFKEEGLKDLESAKCTGCALCAITCPDVAIEVYRETKDAEDANQDESKEE